MAQNTNDVGFAVRIAVSGIGTIGAGNPVNLLGIWVPSVQTSQVVRLWTQTGAAVLTGLPVVASSVLAANAFYRLPGYFPNGLTYSGSTDNVDLTFFWQPGGSD
jgi:hypothetical protein